MSVANVNSPLSTPLTEHFAHVWFGVPVVITLQNKKKKLSSSLTFFFINYLLKEDFVFFYCLLRECDQPNPADDLKDPGPVSSDKSVHFS